MKSLKEIIQEALVKKHVPSGWTNKNENMPTLNQFIIYCFGASISYLKKRGPKCGMLETVIDECLSDEDYSNLFNNDSSKFLAWLFKNRNNKLDNYKCEKISKTSDYNVSITIDNVNFNLLSVDYLKIDEILKVNKINN